MLLSHPLPIYLLGFVLLHPYREFPPHLRYYSCGLIMRHEFIIIQFRSSLLDIERRNHDFLYLRRKYTQHVKFMTVATSDDK